MSSLQEALCVKKCILYCSSSVKLKVYNITKVANLYRGADNSLARPGRKEATATEYFEFHIFYL